MVAILPVSLIVALTIVFACTFTNGIEVHIVGSGECNCTLTSNTSNSAHIVCPNLEIAMKNCLSNLAQNVTFIMTTLQNVGETLHYEVSNFVRLQGIVNDKGTGVFVYCDNYESLEFFSSGGNQSVLSFVNISFFGCGNGQTIGVKISGVSHVDISGVTFKYMLGLSILNVPNVTIGHSTFIYCYTNPYAPLQIAYNDSNSTLDSDTVSNITVSIWKCHFDSNHEVEGNVSSEGISGIFVVHIYEFMQGGSFNINVEDCHFENNDLQYFSYRSPMLVISNVSNSEIGFVIENSVFTNNVGVSLMMNILSYFGNNELSMHLFNNLFLTNNNPFGNYGLLHVTIENFLFDNHVTLNYQQLNFTRNNGTLMTSSIRSSSTVNYNLNNCSFTDNAVVSDSIEHQIIFYGGALPTDNVTITLNHLTYIASKTQFKCMALFFFDSVNLIAENLHLVGSDNVTATMFMLHTSNIFFYGDNTFYYNQGIHGGGLTINGSNLTITEGSTLTFNNNNADYGGAMYINTTDFNNVLRCHERINFINNHAHVAGPSIYTTDSNVSVDIFKKCFNNPHNENLIATAPKIFNTAIANSNRPFFPGQSLMLNVSLVDELNNPGSCKAEITLECNITDTGEHGFCEQLYPNVNLQLVGPSDTFLFGTNGVVNTLLPFFQVHFNKSHTRTNATLHVTCVDPPLPSMKVNFIWTSSCPLGFIKNNTTIKTYRCTCISNATDNYHIFCPPQSSVACIKIGYWFNGTTFATVKCPYPFCNSSYSQDTIDNNICQQYYGRHVVALPQYENDQCSTHRAGTACLQCQKDYYLMFLGTKCTGNCRIPLHPILISLFTVTFQFLIALFVLVAVRTRLKIGAGFVYGPLIFLAIIGQMPLGYNPQYHVLKIIVSSVTSVYLVNLEIFGEIPWCFGIPDSKLLLIKSFYYLGPVLVWLILLLLVVVGRKCPRLLSKLQDSPVQAICLLMMLSFWSMTDTSIHMLKPLQIGDTWYCNDDPNIKYFHDGHIAVGLIAIAILTFAIVPFVALLAMSNFEVLYRTFRLHRFKPIFDEFQSCYVDKHRWYCVVYFISFIIYLMLVEYPPGTEYPLGPPLLLLLLISLHFIIQPYKKHIFNIIDMLLLLDLLVLYFVLERDAELSKSNTFSTVLVHMLTLIPLLYIVVGSIGVLSLQCIHKIKAKTDNYSFGSIQWKSKKSLKEKEITQTEVIMDDSEGEREPLIRIVQNN